MLDSLETLRLYYLYVVLIFCLLCHTIYSDVRWGSHGRARMVAGGSHGRDHMVAGSSNGCDRMVAGAVMVVIVWSLGQSWS